MTDFSKKSDKPRLRCMKCGKDILADVYDMNSGYCYGCKVKEERKRDRGRGWRY